VTFNLIGAFAWGVGLTMVGYLLGQIQFVADYSEYFIIAIVLLSGIPILTELAKAGREAMRNRGKATVPAVTLPEDITEDTIEAKD
jgi:membrane-associated protein